MATTIRLFRWSAIYRLGVDEIDRQHEALTLLLNHLYEAWRTGAPLAAQQALLADLIQAVREHFTSEERIMKEFDYPRLEAHKTEHAFLVNHLAELQRDLTTGRAEITDSIMGYLRDWLRDHMLISDRRLGEYLATHRRKPTPGK